MSFVFILTVLIFPSFPGLISTIRTISQFVRSPFLSNSKTKSSILKFHCGVFQFLRIVSDGIYSATSRFQNIIAKCLDHFPLSSVIYLVLICNKDIWVCKRSA